MKRLWQTALMLLTLAGATGVACNRNESDGKATGLGGTGAEVTGDPRISSGTGGEGAGPTGTSGDEPADNPGAEATKRN